MAAGGRSPATIPSRCAVLDALAPYGIWHLGMPAIT